MMKIDLHLHTSTSSPCSQIEPELLIQRAIQVGLDGICVTDHEDLEGAEVTLELGRKYGFPVFRGVEVFSEFGDILVFGLHRRDYRSQTPFEEILGQCRRNGAVIITAHPCRFAGQYQDLYGSENADYVMTNVDAVETHNGGCTREGNRGAMELARQFNLPGTGGSDAHHLFQVGRCYTVFRDLIRTEADLLEAIRRGRCRGQVAPQWQPGVVSTRS